MFKSDWESLTSDRVILSWISGYRIPFSSLPTRAEWSPKNSWSKSEEKAVASCIERLLTLGAIYKCNFSKQQYISNIFLVPKPDGSNRLILNLKKLNTFVKKEHFKMEDTRTVKKLISRNCFMCTIDLRDAYFLVPIHKSHRKYLRFCFKNTYYEFSCLPFGLCTAPFVFTKLLKPVLSTLRKKGILSVVYLDDFLILGNSYETCLEHVNFTVSLLRKLGFIINEDKSQLQPSVKCKFLGFVFDSVNMTLEITQEKRLSIYNDILKIKRLQHWSIRNFARFLGKISATCQAVKYGWGYTKEFEREKMLALKLYNGNFEAFMKISDSIKLDLLWWESQILTAKNYINLGNSYRIQIFSDASLTGWGAVCGNKKIHGHWSETQRLRHINILELQAAFLGLCHFAKCLNKCEILLRLDNTTAIAYINRMGGVKNRELNNLARNLWQWCERKELWVFATYISSIDNFEADRESRKLKIETEWELANYAFDEIVKKFGYPDIDLFASYRNKKCKKYISWTKDSQAITVDSFTVSWSDYFFYAFPPFSLILRVLRKIQDEGAEGIVVVPNWPSQPWFPLFNSMSSSDPLLLEPDYNLLFSSNREPHPLHATLSLVAGKLCGRPSNYGT